MQMESITLNLKELLRLAIEEPFNWIKGEQFADRQVSWVVTDPNQVGRDDILLIHQAEVAIKPFVLARDRGAAAMIILGALPSAISYNSGELSVIEIPDCNDTRELQKSLLMILLSQRAAISERGAKIYSQLSQIAADGGGLNALVRVMVDISGRGVIIQDKRGRVLASYPSPVLGAIWNDVLTQLESLESLPPPMRDRKRAGFDAKSIIQEIPGGLERLTRPIIVNEIARGYISLISFIGELDVLDQSVIEQGCLVAAIEMSRDKAVREAEKRLKGDLLTALLHENLAPRDAHLWAQSMGMDLDLSHAALRFAWDSSEPPSRRRLETLVNGEVSRLELKVIVNPISNEVTCICEVPVLEDRPDPALHLGQAVLDRAKDEYPDIPARCGVGIPARDITDWRESFRQAGQALEMARRLGENIPLYFPDLSIYRLLMQLEHNPELIKFQEETIGPLLAHEGAKDFILTLEAYFENKGNLSQTAESLYIHRNTLIYRIDRIKEILKLDLDRPTSRLAVQLALHIHRMTGSELSN